MRKAVKHTSSAAKLADRFAVIFLIKEKARFLAILYIYIITHAVFRDFNLGIKGLRQESLERLHAFFFPDRSIGALIDAADGNAVFREDFRQILQDLRLQAVNAECQGFNDQYIFKFVHDKTGQKVRFSEDDAAGRNIRDFFSVFPGGAHSFTDKVLRDLCAAS